jgi:hypothetical protein
VKKNLYIASVVAGIVILLVFMGGCSGDLLGYIKDMIAQAEGCKGIIDLPRTGQTTSHGTRDDGELQMGVVWPSQRFTDNGDTITDNLTGLMWEQSPSDTLRNWSGALTYANDLDLGGHDNWRLPNRKELRSLVNYGVSDSADWLNNTVGLFTGVQASGYWSSTTYAPLTTYAWSVTMSNGYMGNYDKAGGRYVLAVRAGEAGGAVSLPKTGQTSSYGTGDDAYLPMGVAWPSPRFTDNGDGTICDKLTGLMWEQAPYGTTRTWANALTYSNDLNLGGYSDWRLPNVNELESLINAGEVDTEAWLNQQGFSNVQADNYWSSTTYAFTTDLAWCVYVGGGDVVNGDKTTSYCVLAVRS